MQRKGWAVAAAAILLILGAIGIAWLNPQLNSLHIQVEKKELSGAIELGVARYLLDWLPKPEEVFPHQHDGYLWTTVHLSGTIEAPRQDLSPRIMEVLKENPGAALGLLLRQFGEWLKNAFGGE
jgi:hypothetical protein